MADKDNIDTMTKEELDALTPEQARELWNSDSKVLATSVIQKNLDIIVAGLSLPLRSLSYERSMLEFYSCILNVPKEQVPHDMTWEKALALCPNRERYGAAVRRQCEAICADQPQQLLIVLLNVLRLDENVFETLEITARSQFDNKDKILADSSNARAQYESALARSHPAHTTRQ